MLQSGSVWVLVFEPADEQRPNLNVGLKELAFSNLATKTGDFGGVTVLIILVMFNFVCCIILPSAG